MFEEVQHFFENCATFYNVDVFYQGNTEIQYQLIVVYIKFPSFFPVVRQFSLF